MAPLLAEAQSPVQMMAIALGAHVSTWHQGLGTLPLLLTSPRNGGGTGTPKATNGIFSVPGTYTGHLPYSTK